jgi:hypothetical protein
MRRPDEPPVKATPAAITRTASETPIVAIVKYGPRRRNVGSPTTTENAAARAAPIGSVA